MEVGIAVVVIALSIALITFAGNWISRRIDNNGK